MKSDFVGLDMPRIARRDIFALQAKQIRYVLRTRYIATQFDMLTRGAGEKRGMGIRYGCRTRYASSGEELPIIRFRGVGDFGFKVSRVKSPAV